MGYIILFWYILSFFAVVALSFLWHAFSKGVESDRQSLNRANEARNESEIKVAGSKISKLLAPEYFVAGILLIMLGIWVLVLLMIIAKKLEKPEVSYMDYSVFNHERNK